MSSTLVHNGSDMKPTYKLGKLWQYVNAKNVPLVCGLYTCGRDEVWAKLIKRYDNPHALLEYHFQHVQDLPNHPPESRATLINFTNCVCNSCRVLAMGSLSRTITITETTCCYQYQVRNRPKTQWQPVCGGRNNVRGMARSWSAGIFGLGAGKAGIIMFYLPRLSIWICRRSQQRCTVRTSSRFTPGTSAESYNANRTPSTSPRYPLDSNERMARSSHFS